MPSIRGPRRVPRAAARRARCASRPTSTSPTRSLDLPERDVDAALGRPADAAAAARRRRPRRRATTRRRTGPATCSSGSARRRSRRCTSRRRRARCSSTSRRARSPSRARCRRPADLELGYFVGLWDVTRRALHGHRAPRPRGGRRRRRSSALTRRGRGGARRRTRGVQQRRVPAARAAGARGGRADPGHRRHAAHAPAHLRGRVRADRAGHPARAAAPSAYRRRRRPLDSDRQPTGRRDLRGHVIPSTRRTA